MKPDDRFLRQPKDFWANVRSISQTVGYTDRATKQIRVPSPLEMRRAMTTLGLETRHLVDESGVATALGNLLQEYFQHRADMLNNYVEPRLMDATQAKELYEALTGKHVSALPITMNKQKGEKQAPAFLTALVNILVEAHAQGIAFDHDPRTLTTVTQGGAPLRTLARRVDGAFPSTVNPVAIWEIKEYYYTTTFGSRVADGVYETLLDGLELEELRESEGRDVKHYLMVDAHFTWWVQGRSYLCRIVDMLHMGYVDEVLFGREVVERLPDLVGEWVALVANRA